MNISGLKLYINRSEPLGVKDTILLQKISRTAT